jgi:hypothetical protein
MSLKETYIPRRSRRLKKRSKISNSIDSFEEEKKPFKKKRGRRRKREVNDSGEESLYDIHLDSENKDSATEMDFEEEQPIIMVRVISDEGEIGGNRMIWI